jgi:hypothetical protein
MGEKQDSESKPAKKTPVGGDIYPRGLLPVIEFLNISVLIQCFKSKSMRSGKSFLHLFME